MTFCCKLATEFRQTFGRDIVIDMWCYRRFGHNEGDEPSFTQPLMYAAIRKHPPISRNLWQAADRRRRGRRRLDRAADRRLHRACWRTSSRPATSYLPNKADWFEGRWAGLDQPGEPVLGRRNIATAIAEDELRKVGEVLTTVPEGVDVHKTLQRIIDAKKAMFDTGEGFDWATAEALAFGSLIAEGHGVRLSGQDSGRGTFSQRHAVWVDQQTGEKYIPLRTIDGGRFEVRDSPLSEFGVLGFEYGYSLADPRTLVLWEAQFGDFANGAQTIIDQFIAAGEAKWLRASGLVMLLPHGYRRAGAGAQLGAARALSAALRRGQYPGRQLHDAGQLFPHPAAADAARFPQAADHDDAEVAAPAQAGGFELGRFHRREPFPAHRQRPAIRRRKARPRGSCCARASSPTS